jgi:hypothetical protein
VGWGGLVVVVLVVVVVEVEVEVEVEVDYIPEVEVVGSVKGCCQCV